MARILVIDDDQMICELLCEMGRRMGHEGSSAHTLSEGLTKVTSEAFDVVFLDVRLPDGNGLDILPRIRETSSVPEVIIITGVGDPDGAELAIRNGAWDYIQKPSSREAIKLPLVRALEFREHKLAVSATDKARKGVIALKREGIIGSSSKMMACMDALAQAAGSSTNVLITGETGTGKELFAWAIHENSSRAAKPFVVVDCAALTESLVESMLFGHEKGAFTGAEKSQDGMIKQAHGGTLVLDEVGELPLVVQKAFLRVLQEHRFRPLGGKQEEHSDFRLIASTHRNLDQMVEKGEFRKDLFFRIRSFTIELPALRERPEDIKRLAIYHMAKHCERYAMGTKGLSPEFIDALTKYDWPGNVRELVHAMENALIAAHSETVLFPHHLPVHIRIQVARTSVVKANITTHEAKHISDLSERIPRLQEARESAITEVERKYLLRLTSLCGKDIKEACRTAGLSRSQLYTLMKKHGISRTL
jgi:two-component system, NtrC family, response regulator